jgi:hypothetical protein
MNERPASGYPGSFSVRGVFRTPTSAPGLCVTVIETTAKGTAAALNTAKWLAQDLDARVTVMKMEVVPLSFPLDKPSVSFDLATKQRFLVPETRVLEQDDVSIRLCLCHDRDGGLQHAFRRRALVVIGGRRHWWSSGEERLEQALLRLGHHVIFVDICRFLPQDGPDLA